ncbi:aldo/keto reductase [Tannockella kyphosi]|uniref:aldo/keto reductase n=1 Tax=Tannockella kyphosi TaxID=2899121 RepID=UPI00201292C6|nr:aldo/keto reductase [Tannockella kyphosi]
MKNREFPKLGVQPSMLGFGCMRFPTNKDGSIDEAESEKMIDKAMSEGVTYIDTAFPYHDGDSEPFVGRVLKKYNREDFFLATKLPIWHIKSKEQAREIFFDQLKRLDVEYIDFYLLHALDQGKWDTILKCDILSLVDELREEGKIRYIGFSFHDEYPVFEEILNYRDWDFCQLQLNYMDMDVQAGMKGYELAEKRGIPVVVMEPIKGGSLAELPEDITEMFAKAKPDATLSSWALRYVGTLPNVKVILSGMSTYEHVLDNLTTFNNFEMLNQQELELVQEVVGILKSRTQNGCTGCGYCMPCPFGVDIPTNFKYWNNAHVYGQHEKFKDKLISMTGKTADICKSCGACEKMCPQQIKIIDDLKKVVAYTTA